MKEFRGLEIIFRSTFDSLSEDDKKGKVFLVRENIDDQYGDIYFGSRHYGTSRGANLNEEFILNLIENKQDKLIDNVNIATINNQSLLNGGNITISAEYGTLVFDSEPTQGSNNLVNSNTIYNSLLNLENKFKYVVLYDVQTPNYDNITLLDSVENYTFLDVYAETNEGVTLYSRIYKPNGKTFSVKHNYLNDTSFISQFKTYTISGNSIAYDTNNCGQVSTTQNDKHNRDQSNTYIGITSVIGYI